MMRLKVKGFYCYVIGPTLEEVAQLNTLLSFRIETYTRVYYRRLLRQRYSQYYFPAGFVPRIAKQMQFEIEGWELGKEKCQDSTLRDYQREGANKILQCRRGNLVWATGAGKTFAVGAILNELKFKQALFVTVSRPLVEQTCDKLRHFGQEVSTEIGKAKVTVATHQLVAARLNKIKKWLQDVDVLIFDESHHVSARTIYKIAQNCPASFKLGLTGTPWRDDHKEFLIEGAIGPNIHTVRPKELIKRGYLANPIILMIPVTRLKTSAITYQQVYQDAIVEYDYRHNLIVQAVKLCKSHRPTQILVDRVEHAYLLGELIPEAVVVTGKHKDADKDDIVSRFAKGEIPIMISTQLLKEGADFPKMMSLVMAGSGKSLVNAVQSAGRLLRPKPNGERPVLIDFLDHNKYLKRHALQRQRIYENMIAEVQMLDPKQLPSL